MNGAADQNHKAQFLHAEASAPALWEVKGNRFVIRRDVALPPHCIKCGNTPVDPWPTITFSWHHPGLYVLLISPLIYIIVALIVRKQVKMAVPLCESHQAARKKNLSVGALCLLGCIPVPIMLSAAIDDIVGFSVLLGFALFIAGVTFLMLAQPLKVTQIGQESAEFSGASPTFLAVLMRSSLQSR